MSRESVELVTRTYELTRSDHESFFSVCDADIEWDMSRGMPDGRVYHGHEGVREFWRSWTGTWDGFDFELEEVVDADDEVVAHAHQVGRGRGSGVAVEMRNGHVWTVRDGKVKRFRAFHSFEEALEAVGLRE